MAPLPTWKQLLSLLWKSELDVKTLTQPWTPRDEHAVIFSKSSWSIAAIVAWWKRVMNQDAPLVWIPSYFCNQSLLPLRQTTAKLVFYPVDENLNPDWQQCEKLAVSMPPNIFMLVHYFGSIADTKSAKIFCKNHKTLFIEDAAHVLKPELGIGDSGDFVLYSPHKILSMPDGAICVMRDTSFKYALSSREQAISIMTEVQNEIAQQKASSWKWIVKRIIQKILPDILYQNKAPDFDVDSPKVQTEFASIASRVSKTILGLYVPFLEDISLKRKNNLYAWKYLLKDKKEVQLYNQGLQSTPYMAILKGSDPEKVKSIYYQLKNAGWPVSTWPDLPPEIHSDNINYTTTKYLRGSLITLPVHHTLSLKTLVKRFYSRDNEFISNDYQIDWDVSHEQWDLYFNQVEKSNLLQSWAYGDAKNKVSSWSVKRVFIKKNNCVLALCQILQKNMFNLGNVMRVNRGPLWLVDVPSTQDILNVYHLLFKNCSILRRKIAFFAPELRNTIENRIQLLKKKYHLRRQKAWHSAWIDLSQSETCLRSTLDGKWRNQLKMAEKQNPLFRVENTQHCFEHLISCYKEFKEKKRFDGIPIDLVQELFILNKKDMFIAEVLFDHDVVAAALFVQHGQSCTYVIGWSNDKGRRFNAMNFLLWNALLTMKSKGLHWLDIGGIDDVNNKTVAKFKRGLNAKEYTLLGEYSIW